MTVLLRILLGFLVYSYYVLRASPKSIDCDVVVFSVANGELQSKALCYLMRQQTGETGRVRVLDEFNSCKNVTKLYRLLCQAGGPDKLVGISETIPKPHHRDLGLAMRVRDATLLAVDYSFPRGAAGQRHGSEHHPDGRYPCAFQSKLGKSLQAKSVE